MMQADKMADAKVLTILANVLERYGPHFTIKVFNRAQQIARDAGRDEPQLDDMIAALRELL